MSTDHLKANRSGLDEEPLGQVSAQAIRGPAHLAEAALSGDYGPAIWKPAASNHYSAGQRLPIDTVVIHTMETTNADAVFAMWANPNIPENQRNSAHYGVYTDGRVGQAVREADTAWHAGWWETNRRSIGVEHATKAGFSSHPEVLYEGSAKLVADICRRRKIPIDRDHIIGHDEVPGCEFSGGGIDCHTDPGSGWAWTKYMSRVKHYYDLAEPADDGVVSQIPKPCPRYIFCDASIPQLVAAGEYDITYAGKKLWHFKPSRTDRTAVRDLARWQFERMDPNDLNVEFDITFGGNKFGEIKPLPGEPAGLAARIEMALNYVLQFVGDPYGLWVSGGVPEGPPAYAVNLPAPAVSSIKGLPKFCAAIPNLMLRKLGERIPIDWAAGELFDGGTRAYQIYYGRVLEPFNISASYPRGTLIGRYFTGDAPAQQGHVAIILGNGKVLQSYFEDQFATWPGVTNNVALASSHNGWFYQYAVRPEHWLAKQTG